MLAKDLKVSTVPQRDVGNQSFALRTSSKTIADKHCSSTITITARALFGQVRSSNLCVRTKPTARRLGLAWIELHVLTANNRPSPFSADDAPDDLNIHSFIDLIQVVDCTSSSSSSSIPLASGENILRCHVWVRGSPAEVEPATMSNTLLQTFSFALADYITEYKLLPTLFNNHRHGSLEPPASPRSTATVKFADETSNTRETPGNVTVRCLLL